MPSRSLRVLTVAHNAVADSNRQRTDAIAALPGVDVTLLTPRWWFEEGRCIEVPRSAPWRVGRTIFTGNGTRHFYLTGLLEAIRTTRPDVIDLFEEPFSVVALQTLVLRDLFAPRAALVFYSAVNLHRRWRWPYRLIERALLRRADGAHAPSSDVPLILRARGLARQPVGVIPLGVDVARFARAMPPPMPEIAHPRIGFVGRLEPVKGLEVLLDAFRLLQTGRLQTPLDPGLPAALRVYAGAGDGGRAGPSLVIAGDGSEKLRLQSRLRASGISLRAPVPYEQMPAFLHSLDVLVLPSVTIPPLHREQFGRVLVEAMAAGVPVVGSDSGAIPEVIGDAGLVVPEGDAAALATAIGRVLGEPALRASLIERGRQRVQSQFAWSVVAQQTLDLFHSAIEHRRAAIGGLWAVHA